LKIVNCFRLFSLFRVCATPQAYTYKHIHSFSLINKFTNLYKYTQALSLVAAVVGCGAVAVAFSVKHLKFHYKMHFAASW